MRDETLWYKSIDQSGAGETELAAASTGQVHCLLGFFIVPDGDGTFQFISDTGSVESAESGVMKMLDGVAVGFHADKERPLLVSNEGEALVLETVTSTVSGFAYGYTEAL